MEYIICVLLAGIGILIALGKPIKITVHHIHEAVQPPQAPQPALDKTALDALEHVNAQNAKLNTILADLNTFMTGGSEHE